LACRGLPARRAACKHVEIMTTVRNLLIGLLAGALASGSGAQQFFTPQAPEQPEVQILAPADSEMIYNTGSVVVNLAVRELEEDEELVLLLDDEEVARNATPPSFIVLNDLERGEHQLQVLIVDGDGEVVAESPVSTFYVFKASRLLRKGGATKA
jgi:hypothetical protein